jgi:quercetin dioxygenase-like cupin family protein
MDAFRATALITVRRLLCDPTMSEVPCPAGATYPHRTVGAIFDSMNHSFYDAVILKEPMKHNGQNSGMGDNDGAARPFSVSIGGTPQEGAGDVQSGNLTWRTLISGDRTPSDQITLGVADFPPHGTLNVHRHEPAEFYFGLTGDGTVFVKGASFRIAQGIAVFIPGNTDHSVLAGDQGLSIVYGFARCAFDGVIYEFQDGTQPRSLTSVGEPLQKE